MATTITSANDTPENMGSKEFMLVDEDELKKESYSEKFKKFNNKVKIRAKKTFTKKLLYKRIPILNWLPKYSVNYIVGDIVAGITCGLTMIPQSLAYARTAGLSPEYGLYSAFFGSILYIVFGSCKDVSMGPTAIQSILTAQTLGNLGPEHATLLCFFSGLVMLCMGLLNLGFLIDFISGPVASAFTSAVSLVIITSQVKDLLGIPATGNSFIEMWVSIFENIEETQLWDPILGAISITALLLLRYLGTIKIGPENNRTKLQNFINKLFWFISVTRNAILVFVTGAIGYAFYKNGKEPFYVIGDVPSGLPKFQPPPFGYTTEEGEEISFQTMVSNLGAGIAVLPFIAILENISVCKAFSEGKSVDATQEMISIGISNIGNSFTQGYPGTGGLSRSAVFNASGVITTWGNAYSGVLVILSLLYLTELFYYIPKAALASVIVAAVIFTIEYKVIAPIWTVKKSDLIPGLTTFIVCLATRLEIGIIVGIGVNLIFILHQAARPKIIIETQYSQAGVKYLQITPDRCLTFPSVEYVRNLVTKNATKKHETLMPTVIDCSFIYGADYTAASVIQNMIKDFSLRKQPLLFYNLKPSVVNMFDGLNKSNNFVHFYNVDDLDKLLQEKWSWSAESSSTLKEVW